MNSHFTISGAGQFGEAVVLIFTAAMVLLHILFAVCLSNDMVRLRDRGRSIMVLSPFVWAFAALMLGLVTVALYWVCHHSRFGRKE